MFGEEIHLEEDWNTFMLFEIVKHQLLKETFNWKSGNTVKRRGLIYLRLWGR